MSESIEVKDDILFANHILRLFVSPQPDEDRLTKLVVVRPLRKLDLGESWIRRDSTSRQWVATWIWPACLDTTFKIGDGRLFCRRRLSTCKAFKTSRRRELLSFKHHAVLASLKVLEHLQNRFRAWPCWLGSCRDRIQKAAQSI